MLPERIVMEGSVRSCRCKDKHYLSSRQQWSVEISSGAPILTRAPRRYDLRFPERSLVCSDPPEARPVCEAASTRRCTHAGDYGRARTAPASADRSLVCCRPTSVSGLPLPSRPRSDCVFDPGGIVAPSAVAVRSCRARRHRKSPPEAKRSTDSCIRGFFVIFAWRFVRAARYETEKAHCFFLTFETSTISCAGRRS